MFSLPCRVPPVVVLALAGCGGVPRAAFDPPSTHPLADAATCPVPSMTEQFPVLASPPDPYAEFAAADACVAAYHDVILVLGCPSEEDGSASACQRERADIAVALANAGFGDEFIVSGAAVHNVFVEADALAELLTRRGVPEANIHREPTAEHTDENLSFSSEIMAAQGWNDALVVSDDPAHLVMTALSDANCCVGLGRLSVFMFPLSGGRTILAGHYALYPDAERVEPEECAHIAAKGMSLSLESRTACADDAAGR